MATGRATSSSLSGPVAVRPHVLRQWIPSVQTQIPGPRVLLTFDDGPHPDFTPEVAERLAEFGCSAVFFTLGRNVVRYPQVLRKIVQAGHRLGNHSFNHRGTFTDYRRGQWALERAGLRADSVRPPFGRLTPGLFAAAWRASTPIVNWSLDTQDWRCRCDSEAEMIAETTAEQAKPGDVILLHDAHPFIGSVLEILLPRLAFRGLL